MLTFGALLGIIGAVAAVYFFFSLIVSGVNEWYARLVHRRARVLEAALPSLLGSTSKESRLAVYFAKHPLIAGLASDYHFPAYIPPLHVGMVLIGLTMEVRTGPPPSIRIRRTIRGTHVALTSDERKVLVGLVAGETNIRTVQARIEKWFDDSSERVSGVYKRRTYSSLLMFSAAVTVMFGLDSIRMFQVLYASGVSSDASLPQGAASIPIGWQCAATSSPCSWLSDGAGMIAGMLITTMALTLGAPFWFDVLTKYVNLRQTGTPPQDRRQLTG